MKGQLVTVRRNALVKKSKLLLMRSEMAAITELFICNRDYINAAQMNYQFREKFLVFSGKMKFSIALSSHGGAMGMI